MTTTSTKQTKQIKAKRIESLQAMEATIEAKINAIRAQNNGEGWHKHKDEAKAKAWAILVDDLLFVSNNIHNASIGFVDVESVRQRVLRSL
jgi:hypothetical protein